MIHVGEGTGMVSNPATLGLGILSWQIRRRDSSPQNRAPTFGDLGYDLPIENDLQNPEVRPVVQHQKIDVSRLLEARFPTNYYG